MNNIVNWIKENRIIASFIIIFSLLLIIMIVFWISKKGTFGYDIGGELTFDCPRAVASGKSVTCAVNLEVDEDMKVYSVLARYSIGTGERAVSNLSFDNPECTGEGCFKVLEPIVDNENNDIDGFMVVNTDGIYGGGYIGSITFDIPSGLDPYDEVSFALTDIQVCYDDYGDEGEFDIDSALLNVSVGNNIASLNSLSSDTITFDESFVWNNFEYTATNHVPAEVNHITFNYTTSEVGITVNGSGGNNTNGTVEFDLAYGSNILNFVVTAGDGVNSQTYTVYVYREFKFSTTAYMYIEDDNVLYTGSDSRDEIITNLTNASDGLRYELNFAVSNKLYVYSETGDEPLVDIDILRYGVNFDISDNVFYLNRRLKHSDLYEGLNSNILIVKLYDENGVQIDDANAKVMAGYFLKVYYNKQNDGLIELAVYRFEDVDISFDRKLSIDDENNIIYKVPLGITITNLKDMINTSGSITVFDSSNNTIDDDNTTICTGYSVSISYNSTTLNYKLSVIGDIDGDGKVTIGDVGMSYRYFMGPLVGRLSNEQIYAADVITGGGILINDVGKLYRYFMGVPGVYLLEVYDDE